MSLIDKFISLPTRERQTLLASIPVSEQAELLELVEKQQQTRRISNAQGDFLEFVKACWDIFVPGKHHEIMADAFNRVMRGELKRLIINMPPRHCLALDTPIPTTRGWSTMADLQIGDRVMRADGTTTRVIGKSKVHKQQEVWRTVINDSAEPIVCDAGHIWYVMKHGHRKFENLTTEQILEYQGRTGRPVRLPEVAPVEYSRKDLVVDPYVLGVWIGDGCSHHATITKPGHQGAFIRDQIECRGYTTSSRSTEGTFGVLKIQAKLKTLGLMPMKFIPEAYMLGSVHQRKELLRGMMDTDGNVCKSGQAFFNTSNEVLAKQIEELIASVGLKAKTAVCQAKIGDVEYGDSYRIWCYPTDLALLPDKLNRMCGREGKRGINKFMRFEPAGHTDVQCIEVAHPDGLFLAGKGYTVTHNTKSEFTSWLLPAWLLGHNPRLKIIQAMHTQDLAADFGRKVRDLVNTSPEFRGVFSDLHLKADSQSAGKWSTTGGGQYYAAGVGGALAGRGADLCIIDDPISEQDTTDGAFESCWEWFQTGPRQRLQPGGTIIVVMTRWSKADLTGKLVKRMQSDPNAEKYEVIDFPAIREDAEGKDVESLWPEYWPLKDMQAVRANISPHLWNAQYMQNPTGKGSVIVPQDKIKRWPHSFSPKLTFILQSYDLAYSKAERSDPSAGMTFGVFHPEGEINGKYYDGTEAHIIGLDLLNERMDFPALKREVHRRYLDREPDEILIEAKATGVPLAQELRRAGIPVATFTPSRGTGDKVTRLNSVSSIIYEGRFWLPDGPMWAEEVIEQLTSFPHGDHDDIVDVVSQALIRFRRGNMIKLTMDDWDNDKLPVTKKKRYYRV